MAAERLQLTNLSERSNNFSKANAKGERLYIHGIKYSEYTEYRCFGESATSTLCTFETLILIRKVGIAEKFPMRSKALASGFSVENYCFPFVKR